MSHSTRSANRPAPPTDSSPQVLAHVPDLDEWPERWLIDEPDRVIGTAIVTVLTPFIEHLIDQGLTRRTFKRHVDNLWALGGEIITRINWDASLRQQAAKDLVLNAIDEEGGPLLSNPFSTDEQKSFDTTCRKLNKFLKS